MTLERTYWQDGRQPGAPFEGCSSNLQVIEDHLADELGGQLLGCYNVRYIGGTTTWSTHAFGAAFDWRYENVGAGMVDVPRGVIDEIVLPWLIKYHEALYIQQIHDYYRSRIWKPGRGWKYNSSGSMGKSWARWLHVETTEAGWHISTSIADRMIPSVSGDAPTPKEPNMATRPVTFDHVELTTETPGPDQFVTMWQGIINTLSGSELVEDGYFGPNTRAQVEQVQHFYRLTVDGKLGPQTARALLDR